MRNINIKRGKLTEDEIDGLPESVAYTMARKLNIEHDRYYTDKELEENPYDALKVLQSLYSFDTKN